MEAANATLETIGVDLAFTAEKVIITTTENPYAEDETQPDDESLRFILVPLGVLISIFLLSAVVYLMARHKSKIGHLYKHRQSISHNFFDASDLEDDDPTECLLSGKLHIDQRYDSYKSSRELFT